MTLMRPRISVAVCTYNGSRFLPEQLTSIAAQTRLPDEMVVCDDGATDATAEIIEKFARTAPFLVRFIRNSQNLGSTKNFENAIGLCTGDLIALSDQDDIWMREKLGRQAEMMERDPETENRMPGWQQSVPTLRSTAGVRGSPQCHRQSSTIRTSLVS